MTYNNPSQRSDKCSYYLMYLLLLVLFNWPSLGLLSQNLRMASWQLIPYRYRYNTQFFHHLVVVFLLE